MRRAVVCARLVHAAAVSQRQVPVASAARQRLRARPLSTNPPTVAVPPPTAPGAPGATSLPPPAPYKPGFFSRNVGKIVLFTLSSLIAYLYRSSENKTRSKALKVYLEDQRAIEPWEIDEFRMANWGTWDRPLFREVAAAVTAAFPDGNAPSYTALIQVVARVLGSHGKRLHMGHYLDRVVLCLTSEEGEGKEGRVEVLAFLCALSLSLNGDVEERVACLYDALVAVTGQVGGGGGGEGGGERSEGGVDRRALEKLLAGLVATAQVPAEVLVRADKTKEYPFQAYQVATIEELVEKAVVEGKEKHEKRVKEALKAGEDPPGPPPLAAEEGGKEGGREGGRSRLNVEDLVAVLSTKAICAWGECYHGRE